MWKSTICKYVPGKPIHKCCGWLHAHGWKCTFGGHTVYSSCMAMNQRLTAWLRLKAFSRSYTINTVLLLVSRLYLYHPENTQPWKLSAAGPGYYLNGRPFQYSWCCKLFQPSRNLSFSGAAFTAWTIFLFWHQQYIHKMITKVITILYIYAHYLKQKRKSLNVRFSMHYKCMVFYLKMCTYINWVAHWYSIASSQLHHPWFDPWTRLTVCLAL